MKPPFLFTLPHPDSKTPAAANAAACDWGPLHASAGAATPAGSPTKPIATTSDDQASRPSCEGGVEEQSTINDGRPDHRESSPLPLPLAGVCLPTAAPAPLHTSLDPLESSVNIFPPGPSDPADALDISSLGGRFRHSGWMDFRKKVFAALRRTLQTPTRRTAFATCGKDAWLMRSNEAEKCVDGHHRHRYKVQATCCHDRLCTPCANARSRVIQQHLMAQIGEKPVTFITLTLSGVDQGLVEKVDRLYKHFRALRLHPTWSEKVRGGAAFLEVKYSDKARRWHPHLHIIADADFIPQDELCDAWRSITRDSFIVDIRRVRDAKISAAYVTKYASKPLNTSFANNPDLLDEAVISLKGRRLCLCFGDWYGTPLTYAEDETLADDLIDAAGYQRWTPLDAFLAAALAGDGENIAVLRQLDVYDRFVALANAPPT